MLNKKSVIIWSNSDAPAGNGPYTWAIDLSTTEPYWSGWFADLTANFLSAPSAKLLMLAGVDRLDKDMMVGQMQVCHYFYAD